jgi:hypothetical protein
MNGVDPYQVIHAHAGQLPKGVDPKLYDLKNPNNPYQPIDDPRTGDHHLKCRW